MGRSAGALVSPPVLTLSSATRGSCSGLCSGVRCFPAPPGSSQTSTRGIPHTPHSHDRATNFPQHLQQTSCSGLLSRFSFLLKMKSNLAGVCRVSEMAQVVRTSLSGSWSSPLVQIPAGCTQLLSPSPASPQTPGMGFLRSGSQISTPE